MVSALEVLSADIAEVYAPPSVPGCLPMVRSAVVLGGDTDKMAAIAGALAAVDGRALPFGASSSQSMKSIH